MKTKTKKTKTKTTDTTARTLVATALVNRHGYLNRDVTAPTAAETIERLQLASVWPKLVDVARGSDLFIRGDAFHIYMREKIEKTLDKADGWRGFHIASFVSWYGLCEYIKVTDYVGIVMFDDIWYYKKENNNG